MIKKGETLTIANQIIGESGLIRFEADQKVVVREVLIDEGHYSRACPDIWIPEKVTAVKLEGEYGIWLPRTFKEKP